MKTPGMVACVLIAIGVASFPSPTSTTFPTAGSIERVDPGLDAIVPAGAKIEKLADDCTWTEGPIWIHSGFLLFADIPHNRIMKWTPAGALAIFMQPSGYTGKEAFKGPESGSNGMTLDRRGRLTVAGHAARNVFRLEGLGKGATRTVLAERYEGKR